MGTLASNYNALSYDDRVSHWTGVFYRQMRWAGEDGHEEITILDRRLLDELRRDEPDIDRMMPSILTYLARMWLTAPSTFLERVNAQMGTHYLVDEAIAAAKFGLSV